MEKMKIAMANDHAGTQMKEEIKAYLISQGYEVAFCSGFKDGSKGCIDIAKLVEKTLKEKESHYHPQIDIIMHVEKWFSQPNKIDFNLYTKGIMGKQDIMSQLCENGKNVFEADPYLWYEVSQF